MNTIYYKKQRVTEYTAAMRIIKQLPKKYTEFNNEILAQAIVDAGLEVESCDRKVAPAWIRITVVPAFMAVAILWLWMPAHYMMFGQWGYSENGFTRWFRALGW